MSMTGMQIDFTETDLDTLLFFDQYPAALPLYSAFEEKLCRLFPDSQKRVQKTQITFYHRRVFACASFQRVKRKAELPDPYLVITLGLPCSLQSDRVAVQSQPYPGRWTIHIVVGSIGEMDDELFSWVREAYDFSERTGKTGK